MNKENFEQKRKRIRSKVFGTNDRPRMSVFRSNKSIFCQIIDDAKGKTLVSASFKEIKEGKTKSEKTGFLGELIAKKALKKNIKKVVFDKSGYKYHGRIKALADGARKGGLVF
jgi:large subunit ribosomal protein L18